MLAIANDLIGPLAGGGLVGLVLLALKLFSAQSDREGSIATSSSAAARGIAEATSMMVPLLSTQVQSLTARLDLIERREHDCQADLREIRSLLDKAEQRAGGRREDDS